MNTLVKNKPVKAQNILFEDAKLVVLLEDAREISVPLEWYPKLREATNAQLTNWRLTGGGIGIHWESLDEDLSVEDLPR